MPTTLRPYPTRAVTKAVATARNPIPDLRIEHDAGLASSAPSRDSVSDWTAADDMNARNVATIQLNASSHMKAPLPTFPDLTISFPFIAEVQAGNADFDSDRPIAIHIPFTRQLLTALYDAHQLNILNARTNEAFIELMPFAPSLVIRRAARAANAGIVATLTGYFESSIGDGNEEVRILRVGELEKELWDVYLPVLYSWAQDWDPKIAQLQDSEPVELTLRLLLEKSKLAKVVGKQMARIACLLIGVLVWWHRQYSLGIDRDARGWRKEELEKWLEEQVEVCMSND